MRRLVLAFVLASAFAPELAAQNAVDEDAVLQAGDGTHISA